MSDYEVRLKKVEPLLVASVRDIIPNWEQVYATFNRLFDEVYGYAASQGATFAGPALDLWLEEGPLSGVNMRVEVAAALAAPIPENDRVKVHTLPGVETMAAAIHHGAFTTLSLAHQATIKWIRDNGFQICGPGRELYLQYERDGNPNDYVTEIQYPVQKA